MKTTKFFLIVALLSFATLNYSQPDDGNRNAVVKIALRSAMQNADLNKTMHEQLDSGFLNPIGTPDQLFSARVNHRGVVYVVFGTYAEWKLFFSAELDDPIPET